MRPTILIQYQPILPALGSIGTSLFSLLCHGRSSPTLRPSAASVPRECATSQAESAFYPTAVRRVTAGAAQRGIRVCGLVCAAVFRRLTREVVISSIHIYILSRVRHSDLYVGDTHP